MVRPEVDSWRAVMPTRSASSRSECVGCAQRTWTRVEDLRVKLAAKGLRLDLTATQRRAGTRCWCRRGRSSRSRRSRGSTCTTCATTSPRMSRWDPGPFERSPPRPGSGPRALDDAVEYLIASGQEQAVEELPVADVRSMATLATEIRANPSRACRAASGNSRVSGQGHAEQHDPAERTPGRAGFTGGNNRSAD